MNWTGGSRFSTPSMPSHHAATASSSASLHGAPTSWIASGKPSGVQAAGIETVGNPT